MKVIKIKNQSFLLVFVAWTPCQTIIKRKLEDSFSFIGVWVTFDLVIVEFIVVDTLGKSSGAQLFSL
jgi:hypothetical protein